MRACYSGAAAAAVAACSVLSAAEAQTNSPPVISSRFSASTPENSTAGFYRPTATDADGDGIAFAISGGRDAAFFVLGTDGQLRFRAAPDFETPRDGNRDNLYRVQFSASDGQATVTRNVGVFVTDVNDGGAAFRVRRVAVGLGQPLFALGRGDGSNRIFIVEKGGQVEILNLDTGLLNPTPFMDITTSIDPSGEQGLLGMALAPDFAASGVFYVHVNNRSGDTEIRRYRRQTANPDRADIASADVIFLARQPDASNHKGGWIGFGPDNLLYIALGDGGGGDDTFNNGQNRNSLLAKVLRIDPARDAFPSDQRRDYAIPAGNPFASGGGVPEAFALGLRNPFRASFDRVTGNLLIGDVGQGAIEEINLVRPGEAGLNFGWPLFEGTRVNRTGASPAGLTPPVAEYGHGSGPRQGNSVAGGYVYRGPITALQGQYVFGDFISDQIWSVPVASVRQGTTIGSAAFAIRTPEFVPDLGVIDSLSSFGEDDRGNLYLLGIDGEVYQVQRP